MMQLFTGMEYLQIDVANNFGHDKLDWHDRLAWFHENERKLLETVHTAEHPSLAYASLNAIEKVKRGEPIGHTVSMDATSSGLQILAALVNCRKSASQCNLIDVGHRQDAYSNIHKAMNFSGTIARGMLKDALMTALYGSNAVPKAVFGEGEVLADFYDTVERELPGAWALNQALLAMWDKRALSNDWVLPDNHHVRIKIMDTVTHRIHFLNEPHDVITRENKAMKDGKSLPANVAHSIDGMVVRDVSRRCMYDPEKIDQIENSLGSGRASTKRPKDKQVQAIWAHYQSTDYLSSRILSYLDQDNTGLVDQATIRNLIDDLPPKPFQVLSVHDRFACLPHYANELRLQYNRIMAGIADSEILASVMTQLAGEKITVNKMDDIASDILEANYALT